MVSIQYSTNCVHIQFFFLKLSGCRKRCRNVEYRFLSYEPGLLLSMNPDYCQWTRIIGNEPGNIEPGLLSMNQGTLNPGYCQWTREHWTRIIANEPGLLPMNPDYWKWNPDNFAPGWMEPGYSCTRTICNRINGTRIIWNPGICGTRMSGHCTRKIF